MSRPLKPRLHFNWLWKDEAMFVLGFAAGRTSRYNNRRIYSLRAYLGLFKVELNFDL